MTVGVGNQIQTAEYIAIQSVIAPILGIGSGQTGYGQTVRSSSAGVVQYSKITSQQWTNLRNDIVATRQHQNGLTILDKTLGDPGYIALQSLKIPTTDTTIKEQDRAAYLALANQCVTDKSLVDAAQQISTDLLNPTGATANGIRTATWNTTISHTVTVTFPPTASQVTAGLNQLDVARFFFNTGGKIQFSAARWDLLDKTGAGTPGTKNYSWNQLLVNSGIISFGATATTKVGNGTINADTAQIGYYNLLASTGIEYQQYINAYTVGLDFYQPNEWRIFAKANSDGSLTFRMVFNDLATVTGHSPVFGIDEAVTGVTFSFVKALYCSGNTNVIVPAPVATTTAL